MGSKTESENWKFYLRQFSRYLNSDFRFGFLGPNYINVRHFDVDDVIYDVTTERQSFLSLSYISFLSLSLPLLLPPPGECHNAQKRVICNISFRYPKCHLAAILASTAISDCIFITCQNFIFGKYVRLTVCVSVCLCVRSERDNSRTLWDIFTKRHHQL